jgi:CDP-2,3-bis-(O-geranylgeranyl)-sn-glycerol synthase
LECYIISIDLIIIPLLSAIWIMLPAYLPNSVAAVFGGGRPIDGGRNFSDGRRIFGDGKTFRGLIIGISAGIGIGLYRYGVQHIRPGEPPRAYIPVGQSACNRALLIDLCKKLFKRRLGKERGAKWPLADMYDFVAGALLLTLLLYPSWFFANMTLPILFFILVLSPVLHRTVNIIGYYLGVKEVPW